MNQDVFYILLLFLVGGVDLVVEAVNASVLHTNIARLLTQVDGVDVKLQRTLNLVRSTPRVQITIRRAKALLWFIAAGVFLNYLQTKIGGLSVWAITGYMALAALVLFILEWVVYHSVARDNERWAVVLTPVAGILLFIFTPLMVVPLFFSANGDEDVNGSTNAVVTEDELRTMVDVGQQDGILEQEERRMIHSIFDLGNTLAREIMVPRIDMLALEADTPLTAAVDAMLASGYTRVPVYDDTIDNLLGLLYAKDLLRAWREGGQTKTLRGLLRKAYFVPEAKKVDELLSEMQSQRIHMAIVVDEYGGVAGLVTLEDIVEEIFGEIRDEYDQGEEMPYQALSNGEYLFRGRIDVDDFNEVFASSLPRDEADTLGGFIYSRLGHVPVAGEAVYVDDLKLTVEQVSKRRIRTVRASRLDDKVLNNEEKLHAD